MPYKDKDKQKQAQHEHFVKNRGKYTESNQRKRDRSRAWLLEYKSRLECAVCGESHPATLDFHHKDRSDKEYSISKMASDGYMPSSVLAEIEKCIVLCSNCHRKLHYSEVL